MIYGSSGRFSADGKLRGTTSLFALAAVLAGAPDRATAQAVSSEEVVVTGSHIVTNGYQSPTPLMVLGTEDINAEAPTNLADYVNQLPSLAGSVSPQSSNASISAGTAGVNALNLRALGPTRTLVLLDGRRSAPSTVTGLVDINDFPQGLVQRVDVVTGGASAVYGSDAVSGVVNFVLNKNYTGIKGSVEGGETTYGDDPYRKAELTAGQEFLGGRLHVLLDGEYLQRDGIYGVPRSWNNNGNYTITNPAYKSGNGLPQYLVVSHAGLSNATPGGIITNTALRGTYFGIGGVPGQFAYGSPLLDPWMVGGAWQSVQVNNSQSLDANEHRKGVFGRATYSLDDDTEVYFEASWNKDASLGWTGVQSNQGNVTIQSDNAYIPASVAAQLKTAGIKSFTLGTTNADLPIRKTDNSRAVERYVAGADGHFSLFDKDFKWDAYAQHGVSRTLEIARDITNNARLALAQDAVAGPGGQIVCRDTLTNPNDGCMPLDRLGISVASPTALTYVLGNPYRRETFGENVAAANLNVNAFDDWAGTVSLATGIEHREESVTGYVPTQYQAGWFVGNYLPTIGSYQVNEAYLEALVPLYEGLDFNGAIRATDYSTSGTVTTWKAGVTYQPTDDLRLRMTELRDIRAPNLAELFASGTSRTNILTIPNTAPPSIANTNIQFLEVTTGNPALKPEVARTFGIGAVLTPTFLPGFGLSVDYYNIEIKGAIGSITSQIIANRCYGGQPQYCSALTFGTAPDGTPIITKVSLEPFNFSQLKARGLDYEASYQFELADLNPDLGGTMNLRAMATNYIENYTNNGIDQPIDTAGQNMGDGPAHWLYRFTAIYNNDPWTVALIGHGISSGTYNNSYIVCTTGCPLSTVSNTTVNSNHIAGAFYLDTSFTYAFQAYGVDAQAILAIENVANSPPAIVAYGPSGTAYGNPSTNQEDYDILGRVFRIGVRFNTQ